MAGISEIHGEPHSQTAETPSSPSAPPYYPQQQHLRQRPPKMETVSLLALLDRHRPAVPRPADAPAPGPPRPAAPAPVDRPGDDEEKKEREREREREREKERFAWLLEKAIHVCTAQSENDSARKSVPTRDVETPKGGEGERGILYIASKSVY